jgi:hypothetical protein
MYCTMQLRMYNEIFSILRKTEFHSSFDFPEQHSICESLHRNIRANQGFLKHIYGKCYILAVVRGSYVCV